MSHQAQVKEVFWTEECGGAQSAAQNLAHMEHCIKTRCVGHACDRSMKDVDACDYSMQGVGTEITYRDWWHAVVPSWTFIEINTRKELRWNKRTNFCLRKLGMGTDPKLQENIKIQGYKWSWTQEIQKATKSFFFSVLKMKFDQLARITSTAVTLVSGLLWTGLTSLGQCPRWMGLKQICQNSKLVPEGPLRSRTWVSSSQKPGIQNTVSSIRRLHRAGGCGLAGRMFGVHSALCSIPA